MDHYVAGKVIVITGGSSGFGLEAARMLLDMGAMVAITGRNKKRLAAAEKELAHDNLLAVAADATKTADWKKLLAAVLKKLQAARRAGQQPRGGHQDRPRGEAWKTRTSRPCWPPISRR